MASPPTGPGRNLIMTRAGAIGIALGLFSISFPAGWLASKWHSARLMAARIASIEAGIASEVKDLRERAFVPLFTEPDGQWMSPEAGVKKFEPSHEDSVTLSHVGGMGGLDRHIKVSGDGSVTVSDSAATKQVATLTKSDCTDFFRRVIANGLACYSEAAVELKRDLTYPERTRSTTCAGMTGYRIVVPRLKVDREFSIYVPDIELWNYPDIIEYRSAIALEKEILGFVP
jgi:hypothetical protein